MALVYISSSEMDFCFLPFYASWHFGGVGFSPLRVVTSLREWTYVFSTIRMTEDIDDSIFQVFSLYYSVSLLCHQFVCLIFTILQYFDWTYHSLLHVYCSESGCTAHVNLFGLTPPSPNSHIHSHTHTCTVICAWNMFKCQLCKTNRGYLMILRS